jgi:hypothetical protein
MHVSGSPEKQYNTKEDRLKNGRFILHRGATIGGHPEQAKLSFAATVAFFGEHLGEKARL